MSDLWLNHKKGSLEGLQREESALFAELSQMIRFSEKSRDSKPFFYFYTGKKF